MAEAQKQTTMPCRSCAGSGDCDYCDDGEVAGEECLDCNGTGRCPVCGGSGQTVTQEPKSSRGASNLSEGSPRRIREAGGLSYSARCGRGSPSQNSTRQLYRPSPGLPQRM